MYILSMALLRMCGVSSAVQNCNAALQGSILNILMQKANNA